MQNDETKIFGYLTFAMCSHTPATVSTNRNNGLCIEVEQEMKMFETEKWNSNIWKSHAGWWLSFFVCLFRFFLVGVFFPRAVFVSGRLKNIALERWRTQERDWTKFRKILFVTHFHDLFQQVNRPKIKYFFLFIAEFGWRGDKIKMISRHPNYDK